MSLAQRLTKYRQDWRSFPGDAALAYRTDGLQGLWDTIAPRTVHRVVRTGHMIVFAQPVDRAPEVTPPPGVSIASLADGDWPALATLLTSRQLERFRALTNAGRHCVIAWRGSQPIGYAWVAERLDSDVTHCSFPLPSDAAYLWDLYVIPAERCNGIGSALASARLQKARALGFREGWRTIAPSNRASLRTLKKTGDATRVAGELRYVKLFSRMYIRFTPYHGSP